MLSLDQVYSLDPWIYSRSYTLWARGDPIRGV